MTPKSSKPQTSQQQIEEIFNRYIRVDMEERIDCESAIDEINQLINKLVIEAELYGRLHETIEAFRAGAIDADAYSKRHATLTDQLQASLNKQGDM